VAATLHARAVGQDSDVTTTGLVLSRLQIAAELCGRLRQDVPRGEIALYLDEATAGLDVDPPPETGLGFQVCRDEVVRRERQRRREE
jgi:hypothetical protein